MKRKKTYAFTSTGMNRTLSLLFCLLSMYAARAEALSGFLAADSVTAESAAIDGELLIRATDSTIIVLNADSLAVAAESAAKKWDGEMEVKPTLPWFQGFTVSVDLLGAGMRLLSSYGTLEAALRLSLKNRFLPIVELGYGFCDYTNDATHIYYKTQSPFFRVGMDYNMLKNKFQDNRLFAGFRYGFSSYKYDIGGPDLKDPIWSGTEQFEMKGNISTSHWLELVLGCQVKIYGCFHMGWSVRIKFHLASTKNQYSQAYYIPGYGTTTSSTAWSGSYNLIFDLNWGKKKFQNLQTKKK